MYDRDKLLETLGNAEYKAIDENGKQFPPSHDIYKKISNHMNSLCCAITPKHIYTIVNTNRHGMKDYILRAFNINKGTATDESTDNTFDLSNLSNNCSENIMFSLVLSNDVWKTVKPTDRTYCNRRYTLLQPGKWADLFAKKIWEQKKIPCAFTFKYAKVFTSAQAKWYTRFIGSCTECKAKLSGHLLEKPKKNADVIFECKLKNFQHGFPHKKKRQLKSHLRNKVASHLLESRQDASTWRTNEAKDLMDNGDPIPPMLYNATVLRKAKQEEMDRRLELKCSEPIANLNLAKYETFAGIIRNIGLDPFFCMYWTEEQKLLYKTIASKNCNSFLTIDATGSFAKKLKLVNNEKSPHIYLYQCVIATETNSTPVFQMVSTRQDAAIITYFFLSILADGAPSPRIVVIDFSKALLMAVSKAFANCADTQDYLQVLYNIVILERREKLPNSYIRLDVSHFMAIIARWDCLRGNVAKVRQFYLRCIGHLYKMRNVQDIKSVLTSLMIVAMSEDIGCDTNSENLNSEFHLRSINDIIKGTLIEDLVEKELQIEEAACTEDLVLENGWTEWAKAIFESAETAAAKNTSGSVVNAFYNPQVAKKLKNLISYLPLWTAVMNSHFCYDKEIATSSSVEAAFADLKHRVFKGELPMRIDKFVVRHIDSLQGKVLISLSNNNMPHTPEKAEKNENMWDVVENWRGLTKKESRIDEIDVNSKQTGKERKKQKLTYLDDCPDWDHMSTLKRITIPLLKNGSSLKGSRCGDHFIVVRETCAFDSLTQVVSNAIVTNPIFASIVTIKNNNFCNFARSISLINTKSITNNTYQERTKILKDVPIFETKPYRGNVMQLNANCNVSSLAEYLFADFPAMTLNEKCDNCTFEKIRDIAVLSVNVNTLLQNGFSEIENALLDANQERELTCKKCHATVIEKYDTHSHILIDCSVFTDKRYADSIGIDKKSATLGSVSKILELNKQRYIIAGLVSYYQYASDKNNGHYTAYTYNTGHWYMYDDMLPKRRTASENEAIEPHLLMYVPTNNS